MIDLEYRGRDSKRDQSERNRDAMTTTMLSHHMLKHKALSTNIVHIGNYFFRALEVQIQVFFLFFVMSY